MEAPEQPPQAQPPNVAPPIVEYPLRTSSAPVTRPPVTEPLRHMLSEKPPPPQSHPPTQKQQLRPLGNMGPLPSVVRKNPSGRSSSKSNPKSLHSNTLSSSVESLKVNPHFHHASSSLQHTIMRLQVKVVNHQAEDITADDLATMQRQFDVMMNNHPFFGNLASLTSASGIGVANNLTHTTLPSVDQDQEKAKVLGLGNLPTPLINTTTTNNNNVGGQANGNGTNRKPASPPGAVNEDQHQHPVNNNSQQGTGAGQGRTNMLPPHPGAHNAAAGGAPAAFTSYMTPQQDQQQQHAHYAAQQQGGGPPLIASLPMVHSAPPMYSAPGYNADNHYQHIQNQRLQQVHTGYGRGGGNNGPQGLGQQQLGPAWPNNAASGQFPQQHQHQQGVYEGMYGNGGRASHAGHLTWQHSAPPKQMAQQWLADPTTNVNRNNNGMGFQQHPGHSHGMDMSMNGGRGYATQDAMAGYASHGQANATNNTMQQDMTAELRVAQATDLWNLLSALERTQQGHGQQQQGQHGPVDEPPNDDATAALALVSLGGSNLAVPPPQHCPSLPQVGQKRARDPRASLFPAPSMPTNHQGQQQHPQQHQQQVQGGDPSMYVHGESMHPAQLQIVLQQLLSGGQMQM